MDLNELYQELIIDHGTEPRNHYKPEKYTNYAKGINPLCGDKVHIYLDIENNKISNVAFEGSGCAISMASASILTELLKDKTVSESENIFKNFQDLLTNHENNCINYSLGKLEALSGVKQFPSRVKCATLAWHAFNSAIKNKTEISCTEK